MEIKTRANLFLILSLISGALLPILLGAVKAVNVYELFFLIFLFNVPSALLFVLKSKKKEVVMLYARKRKSLMVIALTGLLIYIPIEFAIGYAEHYVSASLATVVFRTSPLLMLILLPYMLRERLTKSQIVALLLGFAGLYLALMNGNPLLIALNSNYIVVALLILAAFLYALASVLVKKYSYNMESCLLIYSIVLFIAFAVLFAINGFPASRITPSDLLVIAYMGAIFNVYSFYIYFEALRVLKTTFVTNIFFLSPFITFLFAYAALGEAIKTYYIIIAVLVALGILIQRLDRIGGTYLPKSKHVVRENLVLLDVTGAFLNTSENFIRTTINQGGRVLAMKINRKHKGKIKHIIVQEKDSGIFTDKNAMIQKEIEFVREVTGSTKDDVVIMRAGDLNENERFFENLSANILDQGKDR